MANNIIDISYLNPVRLVPVNSGSKHFDDDWFENRIFDFEQEVTYAQKWQKDDVIKFQFYSNFSPIKIELYSCSGAFLNTFNATIQSTSLTDPDFDVYEVSISLSSLNLDTGTYYFVVTAGTTTNETKFISEPQFISDKIENSLLLKYKNSYNTQGIIFETGIEFTFRVDGVIDKLTPGSKNTMYQDQILDTVMLSSVPFREFTMKLGGFVGVPDWVVDKVNRILSCDTWSETGKGFVKKEDTNWEPIELAGYPMSGWSIKILEADNRSSKRGTNTGNPNQFISVVYDVETKLFGTFDDNPDNNTVQITEIE